MGKEVSQVERMQEERYGNVPVCYLDPDAIELQRAPEEDERILTLLEEG